MANIQLQMKFDKETTNTFKFVAEQVAGQPPTIDRLYIQKWCFDKRPERITITVEPK